MYAPPEERHAEQRIFSMIIYILAAVGAVAQYAETLAMNVAGFVILALTGFMLKAQRLTAQGTVYASHVIWVQRTMSIATNFLLPVSIAVILYLVYKETDIRAVKSSFEAGESRNLAEKISLVRSYIARNEAKIDPIVTWSITPPILWWVNRCWYGYRRAKKSEPIDFPDSLF